MRRRVVAALAAAVLILGACGGDEATVREESDIAQDEADPGVSPDRPGSSRREKGDKGNGGARAQRGGDNGAGDVSAGPGDGEGAAEDDGSSRWYPHQGVYTYTQSGFEEFCDASGCQREDLPRTQEVRATYEAVSGDEAIVVTAAEASDNRLVRTTTRHTPNGAFVTRVHIEFDYQGANFTNDYEPNPPVEIARLPLRAGMSWRGQWDARTSGTYVVDVRDRVAVDVGGRAVQAWPLRVETRFRGDFEGTSDVTVWVDPATAAVVRTESYMDLSSFFGDYKTRFEATLRDGPGYQ